MAEYMARTYAEERDWNVEVRSAGVSALTDQPAAPKVLKAIREVGGDITSHRAQPVTQELVAWADRILVMEIGHASRLREEFPASDEKVQLLGTFGGLMEIDDPYGSWFMGRYRQSRSDIHRCVMAFMDRLPPNPRGR